MLGVLVLGSMATMLTATTVNVALPSIIGAFGLSQDQAQWVSSAFLSASTVCMLLNAWAVASLGPRAAFTIAMLVFLAGSLVGASGQTFEIVVLGRILQGAGAGLIQPLAMYLIVRAFAPDRQGFAISLYALGIIASPSFGPVLGGLLADAFDWRIAFLGAAPLALLAVAGGVSQLPGRDAHIRPHNLDGLGLLLAAAAIVLAINGWTGGYREGWDDVHATLSMWGALLAATLFLWRCNSCAHPIMRLDVFATPGFARAGVVVAMTGMAVYGSTYLIPLFAQMVQPYSPLGAAQVLAPAGIAMAIAFPLAGRLCDRHDPRWSLAFGVAAFGASMAMLAHVDFATPFVMLAGWTALGRLGVGSLMPAAHATAMRLTRPELIAHTAPILTFLTQAGGVAGISGLAVMLQVREARHAAWLGEAITNAAGQADAYLALTMPASETVEGPSAHLAAHLAAAAQLLAFRDCFALLAVLFALLLIALPALPRPANSPRQERPSSR